VNFVKILVVHNLAQRRTTKLADPKQLSFGPHLISPFSQFRTTIDLAFFNGVMQRTNARYQGPALRLAKPLDKGSPPPEGTPLLDDLHLKSGQAAQNITERSVPDQENDPSGSARIAAETPPVGSNATEAEFGSLRFSIQEATQEASDYYLALQDPGRFDKTRLATTDFSWRGPSIAFFVLLIAIILIWTGCRALEPVMNFGPCVAKTGGSKPEMQATPTMVHKFNRVGGI
jgi:hypothetical protein